jgi:hypothetical protein
VRKTEKGWKWRMEKKEREKKEGRQRKKTSPNFRPCAVTK